LPLTSGDVWLPIIGQIFNATGEPLTLEKWHFRVTDQAGKSAVDRDLGATFPVVKNTTSLIDFPYFFALPATFRTGKLAIHADVTIAGHGVADDVR
jgi:hypothetical protein